MKRPGRKAELTAVLSPKGQAGKSSANARLAPTAAGFACGEGRDHAVRLGHEPQLPESPGS